MSSFHCSWFAGYLTEEGAKEKLRDETAGTFLIRFSTSMVAPGFVLSKRSRRNNDVAEFNIEASILGSASGSKKSPIDLALNCGEKFLFLS